jgi:LPS-assembly protein
MRTILILTIIAIFSITSPASSLAKKIPFKPAPAGPIGEQPVNITADVMTYNQATNEYLAQGNVEIIQGTRTLKADRVRYNLNTQDADATGKVVLIEGEDTLISDAMRLNLETQTGTVTQAKLYVKEMNFHIAGKEVEKTGPNSYQIKDGIITTCDGEKPDWRITAKDIRLKLNGNAVVRNSTFQVKNMPLLYFPYFSYPVVTERQSGFLLPKFYYSSRSGAEVNAAYYWAISPRTDTTFYLDVATIKGVGEGLEYRYLINPDSRGKFYFYHMKETKEYFDHAYQREKEGGIFPFSMPEDVTYFNRDRERAYFNYEGEYYFSSTLFAKAMINHVTDRQFYKDYDDEVKRSESLAYRINLRSKEKDESRLFLTKNWANYSFTGDFHYYENLLKRDEETLQRVPHVSLSGRRQSLFETPFFLSFESSYDNFWRETGQRGERIDFHPTLSLPFNFHNYVKFNAEAGFREISYFGLNRDENLDKNRALYDVHAAFSTNLMRVFSFPGKQIEKIRHSIEPEIAYIYIPNRDQEELVSFDPLSDSDEQNTVVYSLTNRFTARILNPDGSYSERELGFLKIGQGYNLSRPEGKSIPDEEREDGLSDVFSELRVTLHPLIYCKSQVGYNPHDRNLRYYNVLLNLIDKRGDYLDVGYRYIRETLEGFHLKSKVKLTNAWDGFYELRRNEFFHTNLESIYGVDYNAQCWGIKFYYQERPAQEGRKSESKFALVFSLTGLGEVGKISGGSD